MNPGHRRYRDGDARMSTSTTSYFDSIGLTDEWIRRRTGVGARWWMDPAEPLEDVAALVCAPLVERNRERVNISALIVVSCSTGGTVPGIAQRVAKQSGLPTQVLAFDMNAACSGFVYGLISGSVALQVGACCDRVCRRGDVTPDRQDRSQHRLPVRRRRGRSTRSRRARPFGTTGGTQAVTAIGSTSCEERSAAAYSSTECRYTTERYGLCPIRWIVCTTTIFEPDIIVGHQANSRILQKIQRTGRRGRSSVRRQRRTIRQYVSGFDPAWRWAPVSPSGRFRATGRMTLVAYGAGEAWGGVSVDYDLTDAMARHAP